MLDEPATHQLSGGLVKKPVVLVAGTIRNARGKLRSDIETIEKALSPTCVIKWLFIESDSDDDTISALAEAKSSIEDFDYLSLGRLSDTMHEREARLAHCRNIYLSRLESASKYIDVEYLFVADCDGINSRLTSESIKTCWEAEVDWDGCFPNQKGPYHDIYALRREGWNMVNIAQCFEFASTIHATYKERMVSALYSKMIYIHKSVPWIEVDSAFGGCALYRRSALRGCRYQERDAYGRLQCEHIGLHTMMKANNKKLYINPRFINSGINEHSRAIVFPWRILTELRYLLNFSFITFGKIKRRFR